MAVLNTTVVRGPDVKFTQIHGYRLPPETVLRAQTVLEGEGNSGLTLGLLSILEYDFCSRKAIPPQSSITRKEGLAEIREKKGKTEGREEK